MNEYSMHIRFLVSSPVTGGVIELSSSITSVETIY